jgi:1,4-dihydroxy-6-naphthoate synthase
MEISLGFSPCPNDTFIFYALVNDKIDTGGLKFQPHIADVEALNKLAFNRSLMVTKISFNAYLHLINDYIILNSGSALGKNCGPLLISKQFIPLSTLRAKTIAIPGEFTTAHFLLDFFMPKLSLKKVYLFNQIEDAILDGKVDAGVIIHENRFTYSDKGLSLIQDLGSFWEKQTNSPIPLGGIIIQRALSGSLAETINRCIYDSLIYAWDHEEEALEYCRTYAQYMDNEVMRNHIKLYVNDFTLNLNIQGKESIRRFFQEAYRLGKVAPDHQPLFLPDAQIKL